MRETKAAMFWKHQNHQLRFFVAIIILSVNLMVLISRPDRTFDLQSQYPRTTKNLSKPQIPVRTTVPPQCGIGLIVSRGTMLAVNGTKTLLLSAYLEHRHNKKEVRVMAVVLRRETAAYRCLMCCQDQLHIFKGVRRINYDHFTYPYGAADIMCPLPSGCETPSHITVTSEDSGDEFGQEFLEVKNQEVKTDSFQYNFTVCISTMFDYTNVLQMVQSLEILQILGVNKVAIYQTSNSPEAQRVLDYYARKGLVDVIPWSISRLLNVSRGWPPNKYPGDLHYYGQVPALNDCVYRYMYRSRYVALHDTDELILPQSVNSWSELLPLLEKKYGANRCYLFENYVFPTTFRLPPPASATLPPDSRCCPGWQYVPGVNILAHLYHEPIYDKTFATSKIIVNPRIVFSVSVHLVLHPRKICSWIERKMARVYHTRSPKNIKPTRERLIYDGRLLNYSAHFTKAVNTTLIETGLLPEDSIEYWYFPRSSHLNVSDLSRFLL